ncbi:ATP-binding protein [Glaesserella parasuis]|uniref:ATP-binding protein n=1 Tax=Glaesserella parasuis TaxID=738 RepID=UPI00136634E9|nr:ATP-binding protein [Glaesserella parasuis]MDE3958104.1 ATP-binding protein [Glaesserella parasuis]MDE3968162.1 ATP-binding protein [Glaesserella parasuis]MDE3970368.1 ATP-binding protein [Glaesserella parasuis]MDE3979779.1 ATP-binding protein [Glaesserella parasuis]
MKFQKAERKKSKLRLALTGPSGSGKTYGALLVAKGLGGKIAVIDTEKGSAALYSHLVDFDVLDLEPPYTPERYRQAVKLAVDNGYAVVIIDSITHEWSGSGGCLELNEETAKAKYRGNTWSAWNDTKARHRAFIDDLLACSAHVIVTMRSKTETAQVEVNGRKQVQKLGMKSEQNDGIEYEFTTVLDLVHDGNFALPSKDRTGLFPPNSDPFKLSENIGQQLAEWLDSGKMPPTAEEILSEFISNSGKSKTIEQLQEFFKVAYLALKGNTEKQGQAKQAYENRKAELTPKEEDNERSE